MTKLELKDFKEISEAPTVDSGLITAGTSVELLNLSWSANRPCILLKLAGASILLDCAIGMESMASFLPCPTVRSNRISWQKKVHPYGKGAIPVLKQVNDQVFAEIMPELRMVELKNLNMSTLNAIVISNTASLVALPLLIRDSDFRGQIFATDPVVQFGKLIMEDLCDMFERIDRPSGDDWAWKNIAIANLKNPPCSDPNNWCQFYTREEMEGCLTRIHRVFFREEIKINNELRLTPFSSGHSIGSCNWLLQHTSGKQQKIGYFAASSLRPSHPKKMELEAFKQLDSLILTSLSSVDQAHLAPYKFTTTVVETLKMGGNVLIPIVPTGLIYDLFEIIVQAIEVNNLSRSIPIYFISSVAETSLEFANIFSEWLSEEKSARVYKPEEPFYHSELVRSGRIRVFDSMHGAFSREYRQPCIVFAGHPSLRIGEVVHLLDFWGANSRNAILMIDPDYPLETYYDPYKSLAIRAYYCPIETRLDCTQVLNEVVKECAPKHVLYPDEYEKTFSTLGLALSTTQFRQNKPFRWDPMAIMKRREEEDELGLGPKKRIRIDGEILKQLKPNSSLQGLFPLHGILQASESSLELQPAPSAIRKRRKKKGSPTEPKAAEKFAGRLTAKRLADELVKRDMKIDLVKNTPEESIIDIKNLPARIRILQAGRRTLISCKHASNRAKLQSIVQDCLTRFSSQSTPEPSGEPAAATMSTGGAISSASAPAVFGAPNTSTRA